MQITFLGATGTVTGSKYLVEVDKRRILVDCGLFQGFKQLRLRNWAPLPVSPASIDAVVITHAHLDHTGYLPRLIAQGFSGPVYCTSGTRALCEILLPDSAHLQEEDAKFANKHGFSKHSPALPLYSLADAERCLRRFRASEIGSTIEIMHGLAVTFHSASHLLGAASLQLEHAATRVVFSGDLGRPNDAIMPPPMPPAPCDYLVIESTYGDRSHPRTSGEEELLGALQGVLERRGVAIVPTFAVGRAQELLIYLARLKQRRAIAEDLPVYLDSPMAIEATAIYERLRSQHRLSASDCQAMNHVARFVTTSQESRSVDEQSGPMIILAASGMATGGRVVHHLKRYASDPRNLILLSGYQAAGTRGALIAAGVEHIRIHGEQVPVKAEVRQLHSMSAHADAGELLEWARQLPQAPRAVYITHGEPQASDTLRQRFERELKWPSFVPDYRDVVDLPGNGVPH
jgi:metallo-beta-lactamase family protein